MKNVKINTHSLLSQANSLLAQIVDGSSIQKPLSQLRNEARQFQKSHSFKPEDADGNDENIEEPGARERNRARGARLLSAGVDVARMERLSHVQLKSEAISHQTLKETDMETYLAHHNSMVVLTAIEEARLLADEDADEQYMTWLVEDWIGSRRDILTDLENPSPVIEDLSESELEAESDFVLTISSLIIPTMSSPSIDMDLANHVYSCVTSSSLFHHIYPSNDGKALITIYRLISMIYQEETGVYEVACYKFLCSQFSDLFPLSDLSHASDYDLIRRGLKLPSIDVNIDCNDETIEEIAWWLLHTHFLSDSADGELNLVELARVLDLNLNLDNDLNGCMFYFYTHQLDKALSILYQCYPMAAYIMSFLLHAIKKIDCIDTDFIRYMTNKLTAMDRVDLAIQICGNDMVMLFQYFMSCNKQLLEDAGQFMADNHRLKSKMYGYIDEYYRNDDDGVDLKLSLAVYVKLKVLFPQHEEIATNIMSLSIVMDDKDTFSSLSSSFESNVVSVIGKYLFGEISHIAPSISSLSILPRHIKDIPRCLQLIQQMGIAVCRLIVLFVNRLEEDKKGVGYMDARSLENANTIRLLKQFLEAFESN